MAQWIRLKEGLIDLDRYVMFRASRTTYQGVEPKPGTRWYIEGRNTDGEDMHITYADDKEEAQEMLDAIYAELPIE